MSVLNHKLDFNTPPEESILPWVTPESEPCRKEIPGKRKCAGDSGYMSGSVSPGSSCKERNYMLMTPDISRSDRGREAEPLYTPAACKLTVDCVKKRLLLQSSQSLNNTPPEMDSFSDLIDTSLYNEPMDISIIKPDPQLDMIVEENLAPCEISKKITVDLSINSFRSEPITPIRNTPCDRLFKTPASLKIKPSSPRKKRVYIKKKVPKPGAMIGVEHIDFFVHLSLRANFQGIAWKILDFLSPEDISHGTMVSKTWKNIFLNYPKAKAKWQNYVADRKIRKENLPYTGIAGKKISDTTPELGVNRNYSTPFRMKQPVSPPVSPSKFRFHLFQKEARRLKEDEKLTDCPRCSLPSTVSPAARLGRCTRAGCGLEFCSSCRSPYHGTVPCTTSTPASPQRPTYRRVVGSKESKRFLRRL